MFSQQFPWCGSFECRRHCRRLRPLRQPRRHCRVRFQVGGNGIHSTAMPHTLFIFHFILSHRRRFEIFFSLPFLHLIFCLFVSSCVRSMPFLHHPSGAIRPVTRINTNLNIIFVCKMTFKTTRLRFLVDIDTVGARQFIILPPKKNQATTRQLLPQNVAHTQTHTKTARNQNYMTVFFSFEKPLNKLINSQSGMTVMNCHVGLN